MKQPSIRTLTQGSLVAAVYIILTLVASWLGLSHGAIQFRFSEALCVLPALLPFSLWGLTIGCFISNLFSPFGIPDLVVGTLATFLAAWWTSHIKTAALVPVPTILCNSIFVSLTLAWEETGFAGAFLPLWGYHALTIFVGELVVCYGLGLPLFHFLKKKLSLPQ